MHERILYIVTWIRCLNRDIKAASYPWRFWTRYIASINLYGNVKNLLLRLTSETYI